MRLRTPHLRMPHDEESDLPMPNVYDFDKTIVYPDGGSKFISACFRRHFAMMLGHTPHILRSATRFVANAKRGEPVRGDYYHFLPDLPDWREEVRLFWQAKADTLLKPWYLAQKKPDDIIISCSPDFLLQPLCDQLGVRLVATRIDSETGHLNGFSCYGEEKVRRLREAFGDVEIDDFYSDALADAPLARLAKRAFLVKGDKRDAWPVKDGILVG